MTMNGSGFCWECGKPMEKVPRKGFDTSTGKPNTVDACSSGRCHSGKHRGPIAKTRWFEAGDGTCENCGSPLYCCGIG